MEWMQVYKPVLYFLFDTKSLQGFFTFSTIENHCSLDAWQRGAIINGAVKCGIQCMYEQSFTIIFITMHRIHNVFLIVYFTVMAYAQLRFV